MNDVAVYLSRRNLLTLLSKLDRVAGGDTSLCTIIKCDDQHPKYPQTAARIQVTAVEDANYYHNGHLPGPVISVDRTHAGYISGLVSSLHEMTQRYEMFRRDNIARASEREKICDQLRQRGLYLTGTGDIKELPNE